MATPSTVDQIAFRYRPADSATSVTRDTVKRLAERLGVDETQAIHLALLILAVFGAAGRAARTVTEARHLASVAGACRPGRIPCGHGMSRRGSRPTANARSGTRVPCMQVNILLRAEFR
jgi:hypothetical protein